MAIRESELSTQGSVATTDYVRTVTGGASSKARVADLAKTTLEEYSGTPIAGAKQSVKSAVDALDAQFQELIAPTGEAPNPAEIENARVGADGTTYANLGTAIRNQILDRTEADLALQNGINAESARAAAEEARIEALFTQPVEDAVSDWLDEHPEATTTVQDGAVTETKLASALKDKVNNINTYANIEFLYAPLASTVSQYGYGLCCVMWSNTHCIIYDFGSDTDGSTLVDFLTDKGISKVDAAIISHYHGDHARAVTVKALLDSAVDTSDCVFYLPHKNIDWDSFVGTSKTDPMSTESAIKALLTSYDITYVEPSIEGQTVNIGGFNLKFYNVDSSLYTNYYSWLYQSRTGLLGDSTRYNNFSMCVMVGIGGSQFFLDGDIEKPAQENMAKNVRSADGVLVPHHGINLLESSNFVDSVNAKIGVLTQYAYPNNENLDGEISQVAQKCKSGGSLFTTKNSNVQLAIKGGGIEATSVGSTAIGMSLGEVVPENGDLDDVGYGFSIISDGTILQTISHVPANFNRTSYFFTFPLNKNTVEGNRVCQIGFCVGDSPNPMLEFRRKFDGTWSNWVPINLPYYVQDTFSIGSTIYTIVRLFNKLVINPRDIRGHLPMSEITDLNSLITTGFYVSGGSATGAPSNVNSASYVLAMSFKDGNEKTRCIQFLVPNDSNASSPWHTIMMRKYNENNNPAWGPWLSSPAFTTLS